MLSSSNQLHICEPFQQNTSCLWFVFILGRPDFRPSVDCNIITALLFLNAAMNLLGRVTTV